jgi:hypothetical protein
MRGAYVECPQHTQVWLMIYRLAVQCLASQVNAHYLIGVIAHYLVESTPDITCVATRMKGEGIG